jgi:hypothetical protein
MMKKVNPNVMNVYIDITCVYIGIGRVKVVTVGWKSNYTLLDYKWLKEGGLG